MKRSYQLGCSSYRTGSGSDRVKHSTSVTTRKSHTPWSEDLNARLYSTHTVSGGIRRYPRLCQNSGCAISKRILTQRAHV
jgi:hypothetical protein